MDINDLTLGQIKDLQNLTGGTKTSNGMLRSYMGKYVIVRSRNEGVNAGKIINIDETGVALEDARRLYYHKPVNKKVSWYEGVALYGVSDDSRLGCAVEKVIIEDYSMTVCSAEAEKSIREAKENEQS